MTMISEDLVLIRKEKRLSKQDVFDKCRVPLETIYSIEDGSIFTGKTRNKTYLRSYFRTYAKAIGISDEDITRALDEHEEGRYEGSLAAKYLPGNKVDETGKSKHGPEKADSAKKEKKSGASKENDTGKKEKSNRDAGYRDDPNISNFGVSAPRKGHRITPESQGKTLSDIEWEDTSLKKTPSTSTSQFASAEAVNPDSPKTAIPDPPDVNNVDWATKVKEAVYKPQRNRLVWVVIATILALTLAAASVYWFWQRNSDPLAMEAPAREAVPAAPGDDITAEQDLTDDTPVAVVPETETVPEPVAADEAEEGLPPDEADMEAVDDEAGPAAMTAADIVAHYIDPVAEEDTLYVFAYALHGNLEPIRVQSDIFVPAEPGELPMHPYWVEHQEAMRFDFMDEIVFQGALSRLVLIVNGHVIDDFSDLYLDGPRIQLTREYLMENERFHNPADTPFAEIPEPLSIIDRPRFTP